MEAPPQLATQLSDRYRIERELGAGGMAIVYLAHDLRHDRKVALKVLRPELSAMLGADRFLKEIRTTANLQHPHILPLHDSGEADGLVFYVMPYVEGESLRDRLKREHQLPVDDAVRIAREVAGALDYAHRRSVVHRDIKPENILLHDGQALVADFGIALAASRTDGATRMTETGMSLGTPQYMAPEQAMGEREITPKADIYSLGCVLYEMLVGEPPFSGPTPQAIIARVVTDEPRSMTLQRKTVPPHVEDAVLKALDKVPADRFATAAQFSEALSGTGVTAGATARTTAQRRGASQAWPRSAVIVAAASIAIAVASVASMVLRSTPAAPVMRYGLAIPPQQQPIIEFTPVISPDGASLVYATYGAENVAQVWLKPRDRYAPILLPALTNQWNVTFSPDGQSLAFVADGRLKTLAVSGNTAVTLSDSAAPGRPGIAWLDDGTIVYVQRGGQRLRRIASTGGRDTIVATLDTGYIDYPTPVPGSRGVLFIRCRSGNCSDQQDLWVLDLRTGEQRRLLPGVAKARVVGDEHVVYARRDGAVLAARFDTRSLEVTSAPVPMLDSVTMMDIRAPMFDASRSGMLVIRSGAMPVDLEEHQMVWVDRDGRETPTDSTWRFRLAGARNGNAAWSLSPDGRKLAIGLVTVRDNVWIKELPRGPLSRATFDTLGTFQPRWSRDGRTIMFLGVIAVGSGFELLQRRADGTGGIERLLPTLQDIYEADWSPDGKWLVFRYRGGTQRVARRDIMGMRPGIDTVPVPLIAEDFDESGFAISPDGKWIAYESDETGAREIYVRPFPNTQSAKAQVSINGGYAPVWSRNGRELFYLSGTRDMVAVPIGARGIAGERKTLFRLRDDMYWTDVDHYTPWDVAPDGRFIMARRVRLERGTEPPLIVVENWLQELKQKTAGR